MGISFESPGFGNYNITTGELRFRRRFGGVVFGVRINGAGDRMGGSYSIQRRGFTKKGSLVIDGHLDVGDATEYIIFGHSVKISGT